jgi:hypothetical protein
MTHWFKRFKRTCARLPGVVIALAVHAAHAQALPGFSGPLAPANGASVATRWPIVLSHPFGNDASLSFRGDRQDANGNFESFGVQRALQAGGAVVYQPDKVPFASHEVRGQLLYKKCKGQTIKEMLCQGAQPVVTDGIHMATLRHCADASLRASHGFPDEAACRRGLQFNIICHSQGCPDSRYMIAAVRNEFSGELMYKHVVSWSSLAGANKGTAQSDWFLEVSAACRTPACRTGVLNVLAAAGAYLMNRSITVDGGDAAVALSRRYMLDSTDLTCKPQAGKPCPPSFNQRYPFPTDPGHPILYQTFSSIVTDIEHPCYRRQRLGWKLVMEREGPNDGNISLESQRFTTYGRDGSGGATPVVARPISGTSTDPAVPHPGLSHMAYSDYAIPGMNAGGLTCGSEDNSRFRFSRIGLYQDLAAELASRGY